MSSLSRPSDPLPVTIEDHNGGNGRADIVVEVAHNAEQARQHVDFWSELADQTEARNIFFEPWALLPAMECFGQDRDTFVLFVYRTSGSTKTLMGVFPLEKKGRFRGAPFVHFVSWKHSQLFQASPIVSARYQADCWSAVLNWAHTSGGLFVELPLLVSGAISSEVRNRRMMIDHFERAVFSRSEETADGYISRASSKRSVGTWRRHGRRLAEKGAAKFCQSNNGSDLDYWVEGFLDLEAKGWKGRNGTALKNSADETRYFRAICKNAAGQNKVHFMGLMLNDQLIAVKCNFFSGGFGFAFKAAFDEDFSAYSPGVLLELEAIQCFYELDDLVTVDSCTSRVNPLLGRLWHEKIEIGHLLISTGGFRGNSVLLALSAVQMIRRNRTRLNILARKCVDSVRQKGREDSK